MNLSRENKLLLYCAKTRIPEDTLNKVKDIISLPLNWNEVLESAFWHGIAPLLYNNFKDIQESCFIPTEIMDKFKKAYYGNMTRNMFLYKELKRVLERFHAKGVEVIVLKGAALAEIIYGNIALRSFSDLDLLVRKEDLPYAEKIMSTLNYSTHVSDKSQEWYRKNHHHLSPYILRGSSIAVEIHWQITNLPFHINIDDWWKRAKESKTASCVMLIPSPEDMLLHLCLHLFSYNTSVLKGLCDIFETIRYYKGELNWTEVKDKANKYGINKLVYSILYLVKKFYLNDGNMQDWFKPSEVPIDSKLAALMGEKIFTKDGTSSSFPGSLVQLLAADKFGDKVKMLFARIFPSREVVSNCYSIPLSSKKLYFYYLARPYALFQKYGKFILDILLMRHIY